MSHPHPHYVPAGFNPFPAGYEHHVPMQRGYYPPPPQYGQGGWGFGNPPQIFQHPEVVQYIQELNQSDSDCDCSECGGCDEVETFALESDYSDDDYEGGEDSEGGDEESDGGGDDYEDRADDDSEGGDDSEGDGGGDDYEDRADEDSEGADDSEGGDDYEDRADEESDEDGDDYEDDSD
jgi:hypothetical protein